MGENEPLIRLVDVIIGYDVSDVSVRLVIGRCNLDGPRQVGSSFLFQLSQYRDNAPTRVKDIVNQ